MKKVVLSLFFAFLSISAFAIDENSCPDGLSSGYYYTGYLRMFATSMSTYTTYASYLSYYDDIKQTKAIKVYNNGVNYYLYENENPSFFSTIKILLEKHMDTGLNYITSQNQVTAYCYFRLFYKNNGTVNIIKGVDFKGNP